MFPAQQNAGIDTVYAARASYTLGELHRKPDGIVDGHAVRRHRQRARQRDPRRRTPADTLNGLAGQDTILGLRGRDVLTGGSEADMFKFNAKADTGTTASTRDRITDFETDVDHIDLSAIDARDVFFTTLFPTKGGSIFTNEAFTFIGDQAFSGVAGELHYVHARSFPVVVARGAADIGPIDVGVFTNTSSKATPTATGSRTSRSSSPAGRSWTPPTSSCSATNNRRQRGRLPLPHLERRSKTDPREEAGGGEIRQPAEDDRGVRPLLSRDDDARNPSAGDCALNKA